MRACTFRTSRMIERACYDEAQAELWLTFRDAGKYVYHDVPPDLFEALCRAASAGAFVNANIKGHYRCQRDPARRRFGPKADPGSWKAL